MSNTQTLLELNQLSNQSNDIFLIQKRKISEMKTMHESQMKKEAQNSNNLIIKDKDKAKEYSNRLSERKEVSYKQALEGEVSPFNIKELIVNIFDANCWEFSLFDYEIVNSEEIPFVNSGFLPLSELGSKESKENYNERIEKNSKISINNLGCNEIEMRNILIKSVCLFNLEK